LAITISS